MNYAQDYGQLLEPCNQKTHSKSKFTATEDQQILELVQKHGDQNWALIASKIKGRSTRQCRERYMNYLCPSVNNAPWTAEEDELLLLKREILGSRWKAIADFFPNRTDINVKNRWLKLERHRKKENRIKDESASSPIPSECPKPIMDHSANYAGDVWLQFLEPISQAVDLDDFSKLDDEFMQYFQSINY